MRVTIDDFWNWVNERHAIHLRRYAGEEPPWTNDPVLQQFRFTEVFRELDRGTRVCWKMLDRCRWDRPDLQVANIVFYRVFNKPE
ncbi:MAG: hypothetical protein E6Q97_07670, partial [Desulfurellales bacterium]